MKVCVIAGNYLNSEDGIGRYTKNLLNSLSVAEQNLKLEVVGFGKIPINHHESVSKIPTLFQNLLNPTVMELNYFIRFYKNNSILYKKLKDVEAQIYHAVSPSEAVSAIKLNKRPLVTTFHDIIPLIFKNRFLFEKTYFLYYCKLAKKSDVIIADSYNTKKDLLEMLKIPENKIKVVYPGINTTKFTPKYMKHGNIKNILYLGGLTKRKGIYEVLYAFNNLISNRRDVNLIIGGDGEELINLRKEVDRLRINDYVKLLGFVDEDKLISYYHLADLFVYPSKYEGFGYTPLEAMACGIPVLTSDTSSVSEVAGDAAMTVDPYNIDELLKKMEMIIDDKELSNKMVIGGLKQAKNFSWEKCAKQTLEIYRSLL